MTSTLTNERGGTLALFAVMLTGLLGSIALAVDVGMGFNARAEAQRVADASALAGASAFKHLEGTAGENEATSRAMAYATSNDVNGELVVASEVTIVPTYSDISGVVKEVEVTINRNDIPSWFARFLGVFDVDVEARAVAKVSEGGTANQCVLPFTPPDHWHDVDGDTNGNLVPDPGEDWEYDPLVDDYSPWDGSSGGSNGIGYGSNYRGGDVGRQLYLKSGPPGGKGGKGGPPGSTPFSPGNFLAWNMPDPDAGCAVAHGGGLPEVSEDILTCNTCPISLGTDYLLETGNMTPLLEDVGSQIALDPGASWNAGCNCVTGSSFSDVRDSPRVRPIALFDPTLLLNGSSAPVQFNNFAWIFIESAGSGGGEFTVVARFVGTLDGGPGGPTTGPLVQYLRLIE